MLTENTPIENKSEPPREKRSRRLWAICRAAERLEIARVLEEYRQNRTHAAVALGISRRTLLNKIKQYGLTQQVCRELARSAPAN